MSADSAAIDNAAAAARFHQVVNDGIVPHSARFAGPGHSLDNNAAASSSSAWNGAGPARKLPDVPRSWDSPSHLQKLHAGEIASQLLAVSSDDEMLVTPAPKRTRRAREQDSITVEDLEQAVGLGEDGVALVKTWQGMSANCTLNVHLQMEIHMEPI